MHNTIFIWMTFPLIHHCGLALASAWSVQSEGKDNNTIKSSIISVLRETWLKNESISMAPGLTFQIRRPHSRWNPFPVSVSTRDSIFALSNYCCSNASSLFSRSIIANPYRFDFKRFPLSGTFRYKYTY